MQKVIRIFINLILFFIVSFPLSFAQQRPSAETEKEEFSHLELEARFYRRQGLKSQQANELEEAIAFYKKAIALDPFYIEPYNDLGIVYEMKNLPDTAEDFYLKALQLDPYYLPVYYNLACLYERKGDLKKAAEYWQKRIKLGSPDDPWTKKAVQHLRDIALVVEEIAQQFQEEEIINLMKEVKAVKEASNYPKLDPKQKKIKEYLTRAQLYLKQKNYTAALDEAAVAKHLDPSNTQIDEFIDKVHKKIEETGHH